MGQILRRGAGVLLLAAIVISSAVWLAVWLRESGEGRRFAGECRKSAPPARLTPLTVLAEGPPGLSPVGAAPPLEPTAPPERPMTGAIAALALQYEPILKVAKADRFWPVSVSSVLAMKMGNLKTRFVSPTRTDEPARLSDLQPTGSAREYLDYPAKADHVQDEFCAVGHALGISTAALRQWRTYPDLLSPDTSAEFYFLDRARPGGARDFQYWFFYPLNYLPVLTDDFVILHDPVAAVHANADFHEGDFEHVTVHLRPGAGGDLRPVSVTMARHAGEDLTLAWDSPGKLQLIGDHAVVYASFGGHASYNKCGRQIRHAGRFGLPLVDWALCGDEWTFTFGPETPLVNLRDVPWACWPGHFGEVPHPEIKELFVAGPVSPDFQSENRGFGCAHR